MWPEGEEPQPLRLGGRHTDRAAQHVVPPAFQHRARRRRAISPSSTRWCPIRNAQGVPKAWISRRVGGDQIDYADEAPLVRRMFAEELAKHGLTPRMDQAYATGARRPAAAGQIGVSPRTAVSIKRFSTTLSSPVLSFTNFRSTVCMIRNQFG